MEWIFCKPSAGTNSLTVKWFPDSGTAGPIVRFQLFGMDSMSRDVARPRGFVRMTTPQMAVGM